MGRDTRKLSTNLQDATFQSTRPCGTRRMIYYASNFSRGKISIHAPLWDATSFFSCWETERIYFNPRAPVGRDVHRHLFVHLLIVDKHFNPRAPVGRDLGQAGKAGQYSDFNPRAPVGRDNAEQQTLNDSIIISIHAPLWDATVYVCKDNRCKMISIHAPLWDATNHRSNSNCILKYFNPRAPVGRDYIF